MYGGVQDSQNVTSSSRFELSLGDEKQTTEIIDNAADRVIGIRETQANYYDQADRTADNHYAAQLLELLRKSDAGTLLLHWLRITTDRFERSMIHGGTDPEYAAIAVAKQRAAIAYAEGKNVGDLSGPPGLVQSMLDELKDLHRFFLAVRTTADDPEIRAAAAERAVGLTSTIQRAEAELRAFRVPAEKAVA